MPSDGIATLLDPPSRPPETVRVEVHLGQHRHTRCYITKIFVGGDTFSFFASADRVNKRIRLIDRRLETALARNQPADVVVPQLGLLGEELSELLLNRETPEITMQERQDANEALAGSGGTVIYQLGVPVPIELLAFERPVGGVGRFANLLGGRPEGFSQNGRRPGKVVGAGAVLFHDEGIGSCEGDIQKVLDIAFPNGVEPHETLVRSQRVEAQGEIDRLFRSSSASLIHFQCHTTVEENLHRLRLTDDFEAEQLHFREPGARLAPIACPGFTDSHYLREAFGTTAYGFFPLKTMDTEFATKLIHSANERIPVDDLELGVNMLRFTAQSLLGA